MQKVNKFDIGDVLWNTLRSPNESDANFEVANIVDGLFAMARAIDRVADAIRGKEED